MTTVAPVVERSQVADPARWTERTRLVVAMVLVGFVTLTVAWLGDPRAASFSDAGGRLATVKTMAEHGSWVPDLGYWAKDLDPLAAAHPIYGTYPYGEHYVEVTSVPLVVTARPLWQLGGAPAVAVLPALSVVVAAYAALRLARWASGRSGWLAFWFVGVLSPILFYGADFWEHAPGLALALLGIALIFEGGVRRTVLGGLLVGVAGIMRQEMLLGCVALAVGAVCVPVERTRSLRRWRELVLGAVACGATLVLNAFVERVWFGEATGSARVAGRATLGLELANRSRDAIVTTMGVLANEYWLAVVIGVVISLGILLMAAAAADSTSTPMTGVVGAVIAWGGLTWRFATYGLSMVPGLLPAAPVAALGLFGKRTPRESVLFIGALVALPATWMTQWVGGHAPQWGGRYVLLPTTLLVVLAACQARRLGPRPFVVAIVALGGAMSLVGVVWHIERTREVASFAADVLAVPRDVVIVSDAGFFGSETGGWYQDHLWLEARHADAKTADELATPADVAATVELARQMGAQRIDVLDTLDDPLERLDENPDYPGFRFETARTTNFLWLDVVIRRYVAS